MADNDGPVPMTAQGHQRLVEDLHRLKSVERPKNVRDIEEARAHGDLSENAEFHAAKERQSMIDVQLRETEDKIARAQVIDVSRLSGDKVVFGATVELVDDDTDENVSLQDRRRARGGAQGREDIPGFTGGAVPDRPPGG